MPHSVPTNREFLAGIAKAMDNSELDDGVKLVLISLLLVYHAYLGHLRRQFAADANRHSATFYRWLNEAPVLVLQGQCDFVPYGDAYEYVDLFPRARYRFVEGAGHIIWWDREDEWRAEIGAFLAGVVMPATVRAWIVARVEGFTMIVLLPFWSSLLVRTYAWTILLRDGGLVNSVLIGIGVIDEPIVMLQTDFAVYIGIVYSYLPFMVLPLYTAIEKLDGSLLEAAADLGCRPVKAFFRITVPLTMGGIVAGCMLVFIPAVGEFVIPALLGGPDSLMIGRVLWEEFFNNRSWPIASIRSPLMTWNSDM